MHGVLAAAVAVAAAGCGGGHTHALRFCGLARTVNGFDAVRATVSCPSALADIRRIERGDRGAWDCSRAVHAVYELACTNSRERLDVLERTPVPARRHGDLVTLAGWSFRIRAGRLETRPPNGRPIDLGGPPWCSLDAPREALLALRLRPLTPHGGCFGPSSGRRTQDRPSRR